MCLFKLPFALASEASRTLSLYLWPGLTCCTRVATAALSQDANKFIDEQAPWKVRKTGPEGEERAGTILYNLLEAIRRAAILYQPVTPIGAAKMLDALKVPDMPEAREFTALYDP